MSHPIVALDAMGGDHAPAETVAGALLAAREIDCTILLVGPTAVLSSEIGGFGHSVNADGSVVLSDKGTEVSGALDADGRAHKSSSDAPKGKILIVDAPDAISMDDKAVRSVRSKPNSSIAIATKLVKEGRAGGIVSAGNTGAVASAATLILGRIPGVSRPGIGVPIPTATHPVVLLDAGANAEARPEHLLHFAIMGTVYCEEILHLPEPRVGVLSIGEERGKGNELVNSASELIEQTHLNYIGNVEGRDIPMGGAEVVVTDGFTGNVALKTLEGGAKMIVGALKEELTSSILAKTAAAAISRQLRRFKARMNPERYGGAHLLGVRGVCVITHGSSSRTAILESLRVAAHAVERDLIRKITEGVARELEFLASKSAAEDSVAPSEQPTG